MRSRLSARSIGGLVVHREAVLVVAAEASSIAGPVAIADAPVVEEKGPPELPPLVGRRLVNLEIFIIVFVVLVFLSLEMHVPFVLEVGGGWAAMRIRIVSPEEVV